MTRDAIIAIARTWLGTPYHHQASLRGVGCDCLGLVRGVYREATGSEPETPPPYSRDWAEASGAETMIEAAMRHLTPVAIEDARAADVVIFRLRDGAMAKHAAILTSPDTMIHAQDPYAVTEAHLGQWWRRHIAAAFAFPGVDG